MSLKTTEAAIITKIKAIFATGDGSLLRQVDSLPANIDAKAIDRIFTSTPGVFVIFTGGKPNPAGMTNASMLGRWVLMVATGHAGAEERRRHGDTTVLGIGAYDIIDLMVPMLHGYTVPGIGTLVFAGISNLFADSTDLKGVTVYGVDFDLPQEFDPNDFGVTDSLGDFLRYRDTVNPVDGNGGTPPLDAVDLPAP